MQHSPSPSVTLQPQQLPPPPPSTSIRTSTAFQVTDPIIELSKTIAFLRGGLIDQVEHQVLQLLKQHEDAFEPENQSESRALNVQALQSSLSTLITILSNSPLGGYHPPSTSSTSTTTTTTTTTTSNDGRDLTIEIEKVQKEVQGLFKELQRTREGAELAKSGLTG